MIPNRDNFQEAEMKKIFGAVSALLMTMMITSCGSSKEVTSAAELAEKDGVPTWVYEGRKDDTGLYAVGSGKMSNLNNSLKMARAEGRVELSRELAIEIQSVMQTYVDDKGDDENRQSLTGLTDNALLKTDNMLAGSQQIDYYQTKDGTVYVLMYLPYNAVVPELNKTVAEFNRDSTAAFTEAKMAEAYEKYFSTNKSTE